MATERIEFAGFLSGVGQATAAHVSELRQIHVHVPKPF